jgi:hypothetical protein
MPWPTSLWRARGVTGAVRGAVAHVGWELPAIVAFALAVRVAYRLSIGEAAFLTSGYTFYRDIAESFLSGRGFCLGPGTSCAIRVPLYPLLVSAFVHWNWLYPGLPITQAAISASGCLVAYGIASTLFNRRAGLIAAGLTATDPYSVVHSTAMQDTALFNLLIAFGIYLLLQSRDPRRAAGVSLSAGLMLGLATLTTVRLTLFLPFAILFAALPAEPARRWRIRQAMWVTIPIVLLVGGWVVRNWYTVGAPVLTTESGLSLWVAHNPATFEFLPDRSVDGIYDVAYERLPEDRKALLALPGQEVAVDRQLARWAIDYMRADPGQTLLNMGRKVAWAFSGQLSPAREGLRQLAYAAYLTSLHLMAVVGWWRSRGQPGGHLLICFLFVAFAITTAVFWAHTSHTTTLHLFVGVYASIALAQWLPASTPGSGLGVSAAQSSAS